MKKFFNILLLAIFTAGLFAADIKAKDNNKVSIHDHKYYVSYYNANTLCPDCVIWTLTKDEALQAEVTNNRTNDFRPCELGSSKLEDYARTGYDRGHMCPNNDMDFNKSAASMTFLMCNMCPQTPKMNRGNWKRIESEGHDLAKEYGYIDICCGPIYYLYTNKITIGKDKVSVPDAFFKIFYNKENNFTKAYIVDQSGEVFNATIKEIEASTRLIFTFGEVEELPN